MAAMQVHRLRMPHRVRDKFEAHRTKQKSKHGQSRAQAAGAAETGAGHSIMVRVLVEES
jgi:hypothetical protein